MIRSIFSIMNESSIRKIKGKVELYNGSTLLETFWPDGKLQEIAVARTGERGKFFGFGICQKATVKLVDKAGNLTLTKGEKLKTYFSIGNSTIYDRVCPTFYINSAQRDEKTNVITVEAYDALDSSVSHVIGELGLQPPYTLKSIVERISSVLGLTVNITDAAFDLEYENGANLSSEGNETFRAVLNAIAEVTQTIYYVNHEDELIFKRLDISGDSVLTINKSNYFELQTAAPLTITQIISVTELGDNVSAGNTTGVTQYVRDNPFWNMRTDLDVLLPAAMARVQGLTIVPYSLKWRGNFLAEIGDKIDFETKDGSFSTAYILDDTLTYSGGMVETSAWEYALESERATAANPATLGEKLNQTFAKVDKIEGEIKLYVGEIVNEVVEDELTGITSTQTNHTERLASLEIDADGIKSSVETVQKNVDTTNGYIDAQTEQLRTEIQQTANGLSLDIQAVRESGSTKVTTSTGYTFDEDGLTVSKSTSDISTQITENGMTVNNATTELLSATSEGVSATDLHARTYLSIGDRSRFENYGAARTGCFWIGE